MSQLCGLVFSIWCIFLFYFIILQIRILSLSLIVESPKSTEVFARGELNFILNYLKYNINAQAPNFRQLTLSIMKKVRLYSIISNLIISVP